jgi:hypothetical protein
MSEVGGGIDCAGFCKGRTVGSVYEIVSMADEVVYVHKLALRGVDIQSIW